MNTTTRRINTDLLNDPFYIGFDSIFNKMHQINKNTSNYPPYNLIKTGDDSYLIELAVAGFDEDEINVTVEDGILKIEGEKKEPENEIEYLHKGIGTRAFTKTIKLIDTVEVHGAQYKNGILKIGLENVIPDHKKPKKVEINKKGAPFFKQELLKEDK